MRIQEQQPKEGIASPMTRLQCILRELVKKYHRIARCLGVCRMCEQVFEQSTALCNNCRIRNYQQPHRLLPGKQMGIFSRSTKLSIVQKTRLVLTSELVVTEL